MCRIAHLLTRRCTEGEEEVRKIQESVRNEAAKEDDDTTPDGLAYRVNAFELEVERCGYVYLTHSASHAKGLEISIYQSLKDLSVSMH